MTRTTSKTLRVSTLGLLAIIAVVLTQVPMYAQPELSADEVTSMVAASGTCSSGWEVQCDAVYCSTICQITGEIGVSIAAPPGTPAYESTPTSIFDAAVGACESGWELQCDGNLCCTVCQTSGEIGGCQKV